LRNLPSYNFNERTLNFLPSFNTPFTLGAVLLKHFDGFWKQDFQVSEQLDS